MSIRNNLEFLRIKALELGAKDCRIIEAATVKTGAWVRYKCQFGCTEFGKTLTCPPYSPTPEETQRVLDSYKKALLIHCASGAKKDISQIAVELEKAAFFLGYYKAWGMGAGPCRLCPSCKVKVFCRHADIARPSMEACGIDVFKTARGNGFTIKTLDSPHCKATYYALLLIE